MDFHTINDVWSSKDGVTWQQYTTDNQFYPRTLTQAIVFNEKVWVIGGYSGLTWAVGWINPNVYLNDVWCSTLSTKPTPTPTPTATPATISISWIKASEHAAFSPRTSHASVAFDNKIWVIGGYTGGYAKNANDIWCTEDGITWIRKEDAPFKSRCSHACSVFHDKLWIIGGKSYHTDRPGFDVLNDIWYTNDGENWNMVTQNAPFTPGSLEDKTSYVYDDKLWITGDHEVWWSIDGADWHHVTSGAPYNIRNLNTCKYFLNYIWVIGSFNNDIWKSSDGFNWYKISNPVFKSIYDLSSFVYDNKI